ncbi:hypothetical protein [Pseudooceanicola atlanticus]|uniref:hypothetical protein n=1 Tax=Pseudooceanicola atlanticus TaxID=1461694 RepID=UPI002353E81E|nr:hypothetical protein [Pseudooceanicola atlanticus]
MTKPAIGSVGTLDELQVEPGDVVECVDAGVYYKEYTDGRLYLVGGDDDYGATVPMSEEESTFRLISRASDTQKDDTFFGVSADKFTSEELKALGEGVARELARRIKPEPVRETVTQTWPWDVVSDEIKGHIITFTTLDGQPITGTFTNEDGEVIKVERV